MKKHALPDLFLSLFFVLLLVLPLLFIRWTGAELSMRERRMLADVPTVFLPEGNLNPKLKAECTDWLDDHIGFREGFIRLAAFIKCYGFHQYSTAEVHAGSDGWLYYALNDNLKIATGNYPLSEADLDQILQKHLAIRDKLAAQGIEYLLILPASKVSVYPEHMRVGDRQLHVTPADLVGDYLTAHSDLRVVRLKDVMLHEKETQQVYFKTDSHWTYGGAYLAYREIIRCMQAWGLCDTPPVEVGWYSGVYSGEFSGMLGIDLPAEETIFSQISPQNALRDEQGDAVRSAVFRDCLSAEGIPTPCYYYRNDSITGKRLMIYGDSMFGSWHMTELLAENFSELTYIWDSNIRSGLIEALQPDVVMYEMAERYLNIFPDLNAEYLAS